MKTIVVSGACSGVGKTTLTNSLCEALPGAEAVKIGHGPRRQDKQGNFYPVGTSIALLLRRYAEAEFLVLESNSILEQMSPDLTLFLDGPRLKPSATLARSKAEIVSGQRIAPDRLEELAGRLGVGGDIMTQIAWLAGARPEPVAAIILAGGKSLRMGQDKARLKIDGVGLTERIYVQLRSHVDEVLVSIAEDASPLIPGVRHVTDPSPGLGPLMGIFSGLSASPCRINFITACDVPEIRVSALRRLLSQLGTHDAVLPVFSDQIPQPLLAVYTRDLLPRIAETLAEGKRRVRDLLDRCRVRVVRFDEDWYVNINDAEAYRRYAMGPSQQEGSHGR